MITAISTRIHPAPLEEEDQFDDPEEIDLRAEESLNQVWHPAAEDLLQDDPEAVDNTASQRGCPPSGFSIQPENTSHRT
jgi:hypothetical protein